MSTVLDVMVFESGSGGEWNLKANDVEYISGLTNQVYLALFGGNIEQNTDEGLADVEQRHDYWANAFILDEHQYNSTFERTIMNVALNSAGVSKLENAASEDLKYLEAYADIAISGAVTGLGKFELTVQLDEPSGISTKLKFIWDATKNELIEQRTI